MVGNYNDDGNTFSNSEQVRFGSFMAQSLKDANIPWAINAVTSSTILPHMIGTSPVIPLVLLSAMPY